jgi:Lsr2
MAQRTVTTLVDDLDGSEIPHGEGETVKFSLGNDEYEIDLSKDNSTKLRETLSVYVGAARKTGGRRGRPRPAGPSARPDKEQLKAIREWAKTAGLKVADRGRIAAEIMDLYNAATGRGQA